MFVRVVLVDLEELAVVDDPADHVAHVVGLVRAVGHDVVELGVLAERVVGRLDPRRGLEVVLGQEREQVARVLEARVLVVGGEVGHARLASCGTSRRRAPRTSTSSPVTVLITSGPVMNMCEVSLTMKMKSVIAGE